MVDTNIPLSGGGPKCLWEQLVLTLSKQNVCLMKDTNVSNISNFKFGYPCLTLKEGSKVKSDHIKRFPAYDFL